MISDHYIWLVWACSFLVPWAALFAFFPQHRMVMWWASLLTAPFGLTEPISVPAYWNPPSLFNLAQTTGFDIESLIFCFGIGGVGAVIYNAMTRRIVLPVTSKEKKQPLHRRHYMALASPFIVFLLLYFLPWNPIYPGILAMSVGAAATIACRPDLRTKTWIGGILFLIFYVVFLQFLRWGAPGYIERVWNLQSLSGVIIFGMPMEELLFAFGFGIYWSSVYEHFTWTRSMPLEARLS